MPDSEKYFGVIDLRARSLGDMFHMFGALMAEIFLFDCRPMKRQGEVLSGLANMDVHFRFDQHNSICG